MLANRFFPLTTYEDLRGELDRVFDAFGRGGRGLAFPNMRSMPAVNVWDDEGHIFIEAEVPGMKMEDLGVEVLGREVRLTGSRTTEHEEGVNFHRRERAHSTFTRSLALDTDVDANKVKAVLKDGVLTITLPKAETAKARRIEVKGA